MKRDIGSIVIIGLLLNLTLVLGGCGLLAKEKEIMIDKMIFSVNYDTVLQELSDGNLSALSVYQEDNGYPPKEEGKEGLNWSEEDFLLVANSINFVGIGEYLESWKLFSAQYHVSCENLGQGFDDARYQFFKLSNPGDNNIRYVNRIIINPATNFLEITMFEYSPVVINWVGTDSSEIFVSATEALIIAEENGGSELRSQQNNVCEILVNFRNEIWEIWYSQKDSETLKKFIINPINGNVSDVN